MLLSLPTDIIRYIRDFAWIPQVCRELKNDLDIKHGLDNISIIDKPLMPHQYQQYFGPRTKYIKCQQKDASYEDFQTLMEHVSRCKGLKKLDFSGMSIHHNKFLDAFSLQQFSSLEYLNVGDCFEKTDVVFHLIPIAGLVHLKYLNISGARVEHMRCLPSSLTQLIMHNCHLVSEDDESHQFSGDLTHLDISKISSHSLKLNQLSSLTDLTLCLSYLLNNNTPPIPSVTSLTIHYRQHDDHIDDDIGLNSSEIVQHFPNVKNLHIIGYGSRTNIPEFMWHFTNLKKLTTNDNIYCSSEQYEKFYEFIQKNTTLQVLHIPSIDIEAEWLKFIADEFKYLTSFEFYYSEVDPDFNVFTSKQNRLKHIGISSDVYRENISYGQFITMLDNLKNLTSLRIEHCEGFNDKVLNAISGRRIRDLEIRGSFSIRDHGIISLVKNCKSLRSLKTCNIHQMSYKIIPRIVCSSLTYYSPYAPYYNNSEFEYYWSKICNYTKKHESRFPMRILAYFMYQTGLKLTDHESISKHIMFSQNFNRYSISRRNFLLTLRKYSVREIKQFLSLKKKIY